MNLKAILRKSGMASEAMALLHRSLDLDPDQDFALHERALIHQANGQLNLALVDYENAIRLNPNNHVYYANKFTTLMRLGLVDQGLDVMNIAVKLEPNDPMNYSKRATAKAFLKMDLGSICSDIKMAYSLGDHNASSLMQMCN